LSPPRLSPLALCPTSPTRGSPPPQPLRLSSFQRVPHSRRSSVKPALGFMCGKRRSAWSIPSTSFPLCCCFESLKTSLSSKIAHLLRAPRLRPFATNPRLSLLLFSSMRRYHQFHRTGRCRPRTSRKSPSRFPLWVICFQSPGKRRHTASLLPHFTACLVVHRGACFILLKIGPKTSTPILGMIPVPLMAISLHHWGFLNPPPWCGGSIPPWRRIGQLTADKRSVLQPSTWPVWHRQFPCAPFPPSAPRATPSALSHKKNQTPTTPAKKPPHKGVLLPPTPTLTLLKTVQPAIFTPFPFSVHSFHPHPTSNCNANGRPQKCVLFQTNPPPPRLRYCGCSNYQVLFRHSGIPHSDTQVALGDSRCQLGPL